MPVYVWFTELFGNILLENFLRVQRNEYPEISGKKIYQGIREMSAISKSVREK